MTETRLASASSLRAGSSPAMVAFDVAGDADGCCRIEHFFNVLLLRIRSTLETRLCSTPILVGNHSVQVVLQRLVLRVGTTLEPVDSPRVIA